jgi:phosphatidate cytidylyltransferase
MTLPDPIRKGELGRWLVALVLAVPTLIAIFLENKIFLVVLILIIGGVAWWEYSANLLGRTRTGILLICLLGWAATVGGAAFFGPEGQSMGLLFSIILGGLYLLNFMGKGGEDEKKIAINLIARYALGQVYISYFFSFAILIKTFDNGPRLLLYVILVTALADTGAIYAGSRLKGPKLCPKISPNKTISGLMGGCLLAIAAGLLSRYYLPSDFKTMELVLLSLGLALTGCFGDLFESAIKRTVGIKDTSAILLGHGGFWDRLDSLLFNFPIFYFYIFLRFMP